MNEVKDMLRATYAEQLGAPVKSIEVELRGRIGYEYVDDADDDCLSWTIKSETVHNA
jgi:hypothetical protein